MRASLVLDTDLEAGQGGQIGRVLDGNIRSSSSGRTVHIFRRIAGFGDFLNGSRHFACGQTVGLDAEEQGEGSDSNSPESTDGRQHRAAKIIQIFP